MRVIAYAVLVVAMSAMACGGREGSASDGPSIDSSTDAVAADSRAEVALDAAIDSGIPRVDAPPPSLDFAPVCGCDGISYWNAEQAAAQGVSVCDTPACPRDPTSLGACGANLGKSCPAGKTCVTENYSFCFFGDSVGQCWSIPPEGKCPSDRGAYRDCDASTCINYCQAVKTGKFVGGC